MTPAGSAPLLLALDVANRQTAIALFAGDSQFQVWRLASDPRRTADDLGLQLDALLGRAGVAPAALAGIVIGSVVVSLTTTLVEACTRYLGHTPLVVGPGVRTGLSIRTENPREVGPDRVANAIAAFRRYGGPAIVVDCSTAITFDAIAGTGDYVGSVIAPGVEMAIDGLVRQTTRLHEVELSRPAHVIGGSTAAAVQSGIVYGLGAMVDGIVERMQAELAGEAKVIATGPSADLIASGSQTIDAIDACLTLRGLCLIWETHMRRRKEAVS